MNKKHKLILIPLIILIAITIMLYIFSPTVRNIFSLFPFDLIKNILFVIVLFFASKQDVNTFTANNSYSLALLCIGLINFNIDSLIGAVVCYSVFFFVAMLTNLGGADAKIAGACGFVLGTLPALIALLIGLAFSILIETLITLVKHTKFTRGYALVPYITIGCTVVTILKGFYIL